MTTLQDNRFTRTFAELKASGGKALMPFLTAGYPNIDATGALLKDFEARGVRICEIGFPFSDPVADGPTIQASYTEALGAGLRVQDILDMASAYRADGGDMALAAMLSYSIVFRQGTEAFLAKLAAAGFDACIIPDLPLDEAAAAESLAAEAGLCNVMLIAPTTPPARRIEIAKHCRGFAYFVSISGITGERVSLPQETIDGVAELRQHTDTPVCVGFGISNADTVKTVCDAADGAIVGSAIIHRITDAADLPTDEMVAKVGAFVSELLTPII
ncbi:MAG: tryptophan synthase subunit alpha [Phycisphaerales bacterium]|jgi:tryptophan synthase alpha chain|nr:tryptophan synthase subunit alpha [Phycisphaerales bacterium]